MVKNSNKVKYTRPEGSALWEYASAIICLLMIFGAGCVLGWNSPGLAKLLGPDAGVISLKDVDPSLIVALTGMGFGLAPLLTIIMADKLGRKKSLIVISFPTIISWALIGVAKDISVLCIARFIGGLTGGLSLCIVPMYLGEISSPKLRGALGMGMGIMLNSGVLSTYLIMPYISLNTSGFILFVMTIFFMITIWFIPESPYFFAMIKKYDEAETSLEKLRGKSDVTDELELIKRTISNEDKCGEEISTTKKISAIKQLIRVPGNRKAIYILILFVFVLHLGSYTAVSIFTHIIFTAMKARISPNLCATIVAIIQLVFNILAALVVDKFGRKPLIGISGAISGICLLVVSLYFYLMEYTDVDVASYSLFPVVSLFINTAALSIGLLPMHMLTQSEIIATEVKALVTLLNGVAGGVLGTFTGTMYLKVSMNWGYGHTVPFFIFFLVTVTGTSIILKILPETKGKTFFEIQKDMNA